MPILTTDYLDRVIDIPVSMPLTEVKAADWLILATIALKSGQRLTYRYLNLQLAGASLLEVNVPLSDQCNPVNIRRINLSYGLAYVGIIKDYSVADNPLTVTWYGTAADIVSAPSAGVYIRSLTASPLEITEVGSYSFVLVNNCAALISQGSDGDVLNLDLQLCVAGQVRLTV